MSHAACGVEVTAAELAQIMLKLQAQGCHNINLVTPDHVVAQILEALLLAIEGGLRLPLVYNTSAYCSLATLALLDGLVDIYMPDFKMWDVAFAKQYLHAPDYPDVARRAIKEMHRQVGDLLFDRQRLACRGLLVRHLVMPGQLNDTTEILHFLAQEISLETYVNLMDQYHPAGQVRHDRFASINRRITSNEYFEAIRIAHDAGIWRLDDHHSHNVFCSC